MVRKPKPRSIEALRADPEVAAALAQGAALAIVPLVLDAGGRPRQTSRSTPVCLQRSTRQPLQRTYPLGLIGERCTREDRKRGLIALRPSRP